MSHVGSDGQSPAVPPADIAAKVAFLSNSASYPDRPSRVEVIETHFAWVFLTDAHAYKLKKASHLRGADWRTPEAREHACREELELNRQFSPSIYLGVEPLVATAGGLRIGGPGVPSDWLLVMRRLDKRRMLDAVLAAHALTPGDIGAVLQLLVHFYKSRAPLPFSPETYLRRVAARMEEAINALRHPGAELAANDIERLARTLRAAFDFLRPRLAARATGHHIVEGHGDLRAEHIWLGPPVQIIDALEVYADLRMLDTAEEIAMLALDCERHGAGWEAEYLRERYRNIAEDSCSDELFEFYMALRGITRAKLAIWHLDDPDQSHPTRWRARAAAAIERALRHCPATARVPAA